MRLFASMIASSASGWQFQSCLAEASGNLTHLHYPGKLLGFAAAYGPHDWRPMLNQLHNCSIPATGTFNARTVAERRGTHHGNCTDRWFHGSPQARVRREGRGSRVVVEPAGFWNSSRMWQPKSTPCDGYGWLSMSETFHCLSGRVLIIEGDSLARQVFLRLIWWLRDIPLLVEHFFHQHAVYTFNLTHDELSIVGNTSIRLFARRTEDDETLVEHVRRALSGGSLATIVYRCVARPRVVEEDALAASDGLFHMLPHPAVVGVVRGFMGTFTVRWRGKANEDAAGRPRAWMEETLSLDSMNAADGAAHFFSRNRMCVCGAKCSPGCKFDADKVLRDAGQKWFPHAAPHAFRWLDSADAHFTCSFEPMLVVPSPVDEPPPPSADEAGRTASNISGGGLAPRAGGSGRAAGPSQWKMPQNGDCTSTLELNLAMAVLNRVGC